MFREIKDVGWISAASSDRQSLYGVKHYNSITDSYITVFFALALMVDDAPVGSTLGARAYPLYGMDACMCLNYESDLIRDSRSNPNIEAEQS